MLEHFSVRYATDGDTCCRIYVDPVKRKCDVMVTVGGRIVSMAQEDNATFRTASPAQWDYIPFWEDKARAIAHSLSPFHRGLTAR